MYPKHADVGLQAEASSKWLATVFQSIQCHLPKEVKTYHQCDNPENTRERPGTYSTGGWVGPRAGLDRCGISRPHRDSIPGTVQLVASRYTYYATRPIRSHILNMKFR